jgi:type II secretory pathway component PulJ
VRVAGRSAFTIVEAVVALVVLSVGVLALLGSAALTSRMLGQGRHSTRAGQVAFARIERLRQIAFSTVPACTGAEWRSGNAAGGGLTESWQIGEAAGPARRVIIVVRSGPAGASSDTVVTGMLCGAP